MIDNAPEPLWRFVVGDTEAWRKGRLFLIGLALLNLVSDAVVLMRLVLSALPIILAVYIIFRLIFWVQFYLVWIGIHWVRWLLGGLSVIFGFCQLIWSFDSGSGFMGMIGLFYMATGFFLGFAPPVHQFAIRQKENRNWPEMIGVAAGSVLLFASFGVGVVALLRYQELYRRDAAHFADLAFADIYKRQDPDFLLEHASARALAMPRAHERLSNFAMNSLRQGGNAYDIEPANGLMLLRYQFPFNVWGTGDMRAQGTGPYGDIVLQMQIVGQPGGWEIDSTAWFYPALVGKRRR